MSATGNPADQAIDAAGVRVAVVAASWHQQVMDGLIAGALDVLAQCNADVDLVRVPGSFELPIVCRQLAKTHDAVVALGVVIRGGTPHFEYVSSATTQGLSQVALDSGTPVGFGLLTCDNDEQALDRAGLPGSRESKGREAALAAIHTFMTLKGL